MALLPYDGCEELILCEPHLLLFLRSHLIVILFIMVMSAIAIIIVMVMSASALISMLMVMSAATVIMATAAFILVLIFFCDIDFYVRMFGHSYPTITQRVELTGYHNTKF